MTSTSKHPGGEGHARRKTCFEPKKDNEEEAARILGVVVQAARKRVALSAAPWRCRVAARKRVATSAAPGRCRPAARKRVAFRQRTGRNV